MRLRLLATVMMGLTCAPTAAPAYAAASTETSQTTPHAQLATDEAESWDLSLPGTNAWGSRGGMHFEAAHGLGRHALVFNLVAEVGYATSLFASGDAAFVNRERLALAWAPVRGLDLGISESFVYSHWSTYFDANLAVIGDPTLHIKYSQAINAHWAWGILATWLVPTALHQAGLVFDASTATLAALGSFNPTSYFQLSINAGVVIDRSDRLAAGDVSPDRRLVYQINAGSGAWLGVAAMSHFNAGDVIGFVPFLEVGGTVKQISEFSQNPLLLTAGLKAYPWPTSVIEGALGVDVRLTRGPDVTNAPGVFPWMAFAALSVHLFDHPASMPNAAKACDGDEVCAPDQRCIEHLCSHVVEVVKEVTRVELTHRQTFIVAGTVFDADLMRPIEGAQITFAGFEHTPVAVEAKTGTYRSFPLDVGHGLLRMRVIAPNYVPFEHLLNRDTAAKEVYVDIPMHKATRPELGVLRGSLNDARTGRAIASGKVVLLTLSQTIIADKKGQFSGQVVTGHHDILVVATGYVTQRKRISVHADDVIILNVDMQREGDAARDRDP